MGSWLEVSPTISADDARIFCSSHSRIPSQRTAGRVGLCYIVALFCFGLSTETFNLKYTISFYALMVSALAAQVLRPQSD
jgi:O-antigen ligase